MAFNVDTLNLKFKRHLIFEPDYDIPEKFIPDWIKFKQRFFSITTDKHDEALFVRVWKNNCKIPSNQVVPILDSDSYQGQYINIDANNWTRSTYRTGLRFEALPVNAWSVEELDDLIYAFKVTCEYFTHNLTRGIIGYIKYENMTEDEN